jgi:hypothetical protein
MRKITWLGIILCLVGCGPSVQMDQAADSITEGWYHPKKMEAARAQDNDYCDALCTSA